MRTHDDSGLSIFQALAQLRNVKAADSGICETEGNLLESFADDDSYTFEEALTLYI